MSDKAVKLFRKHTLSTGLIKLRQLQVPPAGSVPVNGSSAGAKIPSLYLPARRTMQAGCCGCRDNGSEIKDVKELLKATWKR